MGIFITKEYIMKKTIRLTESDLSKIVKSVLNERRLSASELIKDMTLRDVVEVVNSFSNKQISLKEVKEKIEYMFRPSGGRMNENMGDVYSDSNEDINYDIKAMDCGEYSNDGHVDIDDDDTIVIRYCKGDEDKLDRLKRRGKKLLYSKYGG